jgi:hypothetical protein
MKRRNFILISTAAVAAIGIPWALWPDPYADLSKATPPPLVLAQICDEPTVVKIGKQYREAVPIENKLPALGKLLFADDAGNEIQNKEKISWSVILEERIRKDFEAGRTIIISGWVLALTEARQCAAYSFSH